MLRRKRLPESLGPPFEAFLAVVERVERAKEALTAAVPTTRLPGRPFAEALLEFEEELHETDTRMDGWRAEAVAAEWRAAHEGLDAARQMAERLRLEAPDSAGFESLVGAIQDLMDPLEVFAHAAVRFRALRA